LGAIGTAGLRHVRPAAAAFAAERLGALAHQIDRAEARREVRRYADHDAGLAVVGRADDRNDAGAYPLLALVGEAAQVLEIDARHRAAEEINAGNLARIAV